MKVMKTLGYMHWVITRIRIVTVSLILVGIGLLASNISDAYREVTTTRPLAHVTAVIEEVYDTSIKTRYTFGSDDKCFVKLVYYLFLNVQTGEYYEMVMENTRAIWAKGFHQFERTIILPSSVPRDGRDVGYTVGAYVQCIGDSAGYDYHYMVATPVVSFRINGQTDPD